MSNRNTTNIPASIKARLLNLARRTGRPFQEILQYFGMERFLFRLCRTSHCDRFILKGALLFQVWDLKDRRTTRDIDMLAMVDNSPHHLTMIVRNICGCDVDDLDGIIYDPNSIVSEVMQSQREYEGIRIHFQAQLESAKIPMQIDVGFGDIVTPAPEQITYPTLLDLPAPSLRGYPAETVIAEKLHAMVEKGMLNSRLKDYHDIWLLLRQGCWEKRVVEQALERTFKQRGTNFMRAQLFQLIEHYGSAADRQLLWKRYCRKGKYEIVPQNLEQVCSDILRVLQN